MDTKINVRSVWLGFAALGLAMFPITIRAQDADTRTQELERKLLERDKVILELLERVEILERRVGVEHIGSESSAPPADALKPDMMPGKENRRRNPRWCAGYGRCQRGGGGTCPRTLLDSRGGVAAATWCPGDGTRRNIRQARSFDPEPLYS